MTSKIKNARDSVLLASLTHSSNDHSSEMPENVVKLKKMMLLEGSECYYL